MKTYKLLFERDEEGYWVASVPELAGCHTQGRSIHQARERIREVLELLGRDPKRVRLAEEVRLPAMARRSVERQRLDRERAERELGRAQEATRRAVRVLTRSLRLSVRDAGEILKLSHQRVQQLRG